MIKKITYCTFLLLLITFISCKKAGNAANCFANEPVVVDINEISAVISKAGNDYYITPEGSIDTQFKPCNLTSDFKVSGLHVTVSGDVKTLVEPGLCCVSYFVITKITK